MSKGLGLFGPPYPSISNKPTKKHWPPTSGELMYYLVKRSIKAFEKDSDFIHWLCLSKHYGAEYLAE